MKKVNPYTFQPQNEAQFSALEAWKRIEPNNPTSFNFYLKAYHLGLPSSMFFQFASEIEQDPSVRNKGKIFNVKVMSYLKRKTKL